VRWCRRVTESIVAYVLFALIIVVAWTTLQRMWHVWPGGTERQVVATAPKSPAFFIGRTPSEAELDAKFSQTKNVTANRFDEDAAAFGHGLQVKANQALRSDLSALLEGWAKSLSNAASNR